MKLKQVIWKEISNSGLFVSNEGVIKDSIGNHVMKIESKQDWEIHWAIHFSENDMLMIEDDEEPLDERLGGRISEEEFFRNDIKGH